MLLLGLRSSVLIRTQSVEHSTSLQLTRSIVKVSGIGPCVYGSDSRSHTQSHIGLHDIVIRSTRMTSPQFSDLAASEFGLIQDWSSVNKLRTYQLLQN